MRIEEEIVQAAFKNPLEKAKVNIAFTSNFLNRKMADILKPFDITIQQYNILRILRGQFPKPASITLLTDRMIDKMSNASRLVEKLLAKDLVDRTTCPEDRRQVEVLITEKGLELLAILTVELDNKQSTGNNLTNKELALLSDLLDRIRD